MVNVEFISLVGPHQLSGAEYENAKSEFWPGHFQDARQLRFVLDDIIYVATEDPDDGYRSSLDSLIRADGPPVSNTFSPVPVIGRLREHGEYGGPCDILEFVHAVHGGVVLAVGTDNADDYYPWAVLNFYPTALGVVQ